MQTEEFLDEPIETRMPSGAVIHHHPENHMNSIQAPIHRDELFALKVAIHQPQTFEEIQHQRHGRLAVVNRLGVHILARRNMRLLRWLINVVARPALHPGRRNPKLVEPELPLLPHNIKRDDSPFRIHEEILDEHAGHRHLQVRWCQGSLWLPTPGRDLAERLMPSAV